MNGNTPYAGTPDVTPAGQQAAVDVDELTPEQRRHLRDSVADIATLTRKYLPEEYVIGSQVTNSLTGPQASVSVQPPVGHIVSAGFEPEQHELDDDELIDAERARRSRPGSRGQRRPASQAGNRGQNHADRPLGGRLDGGRLNIASAMKPTDTMLATIIPRWNGIESVAAATNPTSNTDGTASRTRS